MPLLNGYKDFSLAITAKGFLLGQLIKIMSRLPGENLKWIIVFFRVIALWKFGHWKLLLKRLSLQLWKFFEIFYFIFKSFVKVELSYVFTINLFTIAENFT